MISPQTKATIRLHFVTVIAVMVPFFVCHQVLGAGGACQQRTHELSVKTYEIDRVRPSSNALRFARPDLTLQIQKNVRSLESGDSIILKNQERVTLGKFLGEGGNVRVFEIVEEPGWAARFPSISKELSLFTRIFVGINSYLETYETLSALKRAGYPVLEVKLRDRLVLVEKLNSYDRLLDLASRAQSEQLKPGDQKKLEALPRFVQTFIGKRLAPKDVHPGNVVWHEAKGEWVIADAAGLSVVTELKVDEINPAWRDFFGPIESHVFFREIRRFVTVANHYSK